MPTLPRRDLSAEVAKHFRGTPDERFRAAVRLGGEMLDAFLATLPPGTDRETARDLLRRNKNRGRRRSPLMEAPRK
jgi:hypothetical protein